MESITAEKDIGHPFSYNHYVPYSKETLKNLMEHFMALNQHDNMGIQKMISEQRE